MKTTKCYIILGELKKPNDYKPIFIGYKGYKHEYYVDEIYRKKILVHPVYNNSTPELEQKTQSYNTTEKLIELFERYELPFLRNKYKDYEWKYYRVGSKKCPVKIDWTYDVVRRKDKKLSYKFFNFVEK